ncbi:DEP domain-containing mTOR-interacting protein-like [Rhinophrynus dorsalis]
MELLSTSLVKRAEEYQRRAEISVAGEQLRLRLHNAKLIKDRCYHMRTYPNCFVAREVIDWLIEHKDSPDRETAISIMQKLVDCNVIHHVCDEHAVFKDAKLLYRFRNDDGTLSPSIQVKICVRGQRIYEMMTSQEDSILQIREQGSERYRRTFRGSQILDWLLDHGEVSSREDGRKLCRSLLEYGIIQHVTGHHHFSDSDLLFQFCINFRRRRKLTEVLNDMDPMTDSKQESPDSPFCLRKLSAELPHGSFVCDSVTVNIEDRNSSIRIRLLDEDTNVHLLFVRRLKPADSITITNEYGSSTITFKLLAEDSGKSRHGVTSETENGSKFITDNLQADDSGKAKYVVGAKEFSTIPDGGNGEPKAGIPKYNRAALGVLTFLVYGVGAELVEVKPCCDGVSISGDFFTYSGLILTGSSSRPMNRSRYLWSGKAATPLRVLLPVTATLHPQCLLFHSHQTIILCSVFFSSPPQVLTRPVTVDELLSPGAPYIRKILTIVGDDVGWGFVIRGSGPCHVQALDPCGPAAAAGMKVRQFLCKANGTCCLRLDHQTISRHIGAGPRTLVLEVLERID